MSHGKSSHRITVVCISVLVAWTLQFVHIAMHWDAFGPEYTKELQRRYQHNDTHVWNSEGDKVIMESCLIFFGATYSMGKFLYGILGAQQQRKELEGWSRWHMVLLNGAMSTMLLIFAFDDKRHVGGLIIPILVAVSTILLTFRGAFRRSPKDEVPREVPY